MGLKAGLNQNDINLTRRMLQAGNSVEEIARACKVRTDVMAHYIESLDKPKTAKKKVAKKKATKVEDPVVKADDNGDED